MKPILLLSNISLNASARRELLEGVEHLVIPCIAVKEGVLNNIFYSADVLSAFANTWNGVPVPVNHPMSSEGEAITANSIVCQNTVNIGRFYNVEWDSALLALKGEIWINIDKATKLGYTEIVERLEKGEVMEVSTGLYGNTVEEAGTFNNVSYDYTITDIRPDHLALLPNDIGACSIKDGCGAMRTNTKPKQTFWDKVKSFFCVNDTSFDQIREGIYKALYVELGDANAYPYILDVFDGYFVYEFNSKLYKRSYTLDLKDVVILVGESVEVRLERSYIPVSAELNNNKQMKPKKRNAIVNALALALAVSADVFANHEDTKLEEAATMYKLNFDDEGNEVKANCGCHKHTEIKPNAVVPVVTNGLSDFEKATLARLQANEDKRLDQKREKVLATNKNLTKEIVATFNEDALDALIPNIVDPTVNYGISGAQPVNNEYKAPSVLLGE